MIQYIDKPVEEMTYSELEVEIYVQTWIKERVRREKRDLEYKQRKKQEMIDEFYSFDEITAMYKRGDIGENQAKSYRIKRARNEGDINKWNDRIAFADMFLFHINAYLERLKEEKNKVKYGKDYARRAG